MQSSRTVVGVDIAKRVFQLHWVDVETGELADRQLTRAKFPGAFRQSRAGPARHGGMRRRTALGAAIAGAGPRGPSAAGEDGAAVRQRQQERCARRAGDLDGGSATRDQDGCGQERGTTGGSGAASDAPATGEVPHRADQRPAGSVGRIRRSHAARASRDEAGTWPGPSSGSRSGCR